MHIGIASRDNNNVVTEIKEAYFEIYTTQVACPLAFLFKTSQTANHYYKTCHYNAFNVYRRELAPVTVSLTGDRAQGDDSKH